MRQGIYKPYKGKLTHVSEIAQHERVKAVCGGLGMAIFMAVAYVLYCIC